MTDISIQFHALPKELMTLIEEAQADSRIALVAIRLRPFSMQRVTSENLRSLFLDPVWCRWIFSLGGPNLSVQNELEFLEVNPDALRLDIGRISDHGLEQSWLSARTKNSNAMDIWKKVASQIKRITKAGVTAINPATGATSRIKSFRYTEGAKALEAIGTPMLPPAGATLLRFD